MENSLIVGDRFEGVLLETIIDNRSTRPRVRPLEYFEKDIRVEFPRNLREDNPIGTRFRGDVKVSQKTKDNQPYGSIYLVVTDKSIEKVQDYTPQKLIKARRLNTASDRSYEYIEEEFKVERKLITFKEIRDRAYENVRDSSTTVDTSTTSAYRRSDLIRTYALVRSRGKCEGCNNNAPFLRKNDKPYLEVHHLNELSKNGHDSPLNVIALCPNCHARVTHGKDGEIYNIQLKLKISELEKEMNV